jgi:hypothetical protein
VLQANELTPEAEQPLRPGPPGRLSALSVSLCKSVFYGAFVWARRALNSQKRRFPARAVEAAARLWDAEPLDEAAERAADANGDGALDAAELARVAAGREQAAAALRRRLVPDAAGPVAESALAGGLPARAAGGAAACWLDLRCN